MKKCVLWMLRENGTLFTEQLLRVTIVNILESEGQNQQLIKGNVIFKTYLCSRKRFSTTWLFSSRSSLTFASALPGLNFQAHMP